MNFFQFVNSKDIRAHLQTIGYQFTSLEAAWLVWQSTEVSMSEKHKAWEYIIETMPDCEMTERPNMTARPSLHGFLRELMAFENRQINQLEVSEPNTIYYYAYYCPYDSHWKIDNDDISVEFNVCKENGMTYLKEPANPDNRSLADRRFHISKIWADCARRPITAEFDADGTLLSIICYGDRTDYEDELVCYGFEGMWFAFPTPFQRGDIVCQKGFEEDNDYCCGPFVLEELSSAERFRERLAKHGDWSDMTAWGYFQHSESGDIYHDCMHDYMSLEYYRGELTGDRRILKALSNYLNGKIGIELYSRAYRTILEEKHLRELSPGAGWFTQEALELAGLC